jgi:hypothetical protein
MKRYRVKRVQDRKGRGSFRYPGTGIFEGQVVGSGLRSTNPIRKVVYELMG